MLAHGAVGPSYLPKRDMRREKQRESARREPHLRRAAAIGRINPLRHDALKAHAADMLEHGRAVTRQMLAVPDGSPLGLADQLGEPPLAVDQRQITQVLAVARSGR